MRRVTVRPAAPRPPDDAIFAGETLAVARALLGCTLLRDGCGGVIVEVEAYTDDAASHFVTRPNAGRIMGESHGLVYVYSIYGVHRCLNFTTDARGPGAVLIRALEPTHGIDAMRARRGVEHVAQLCSGPGKLAIALDAGRDLTGRRVSDAFTLIPREREPSIVTSMRIGISVAKRLPWRFCVKGSRFVSR